MSDTHDNNIIPHAVLVAAREAKHDASVPTSNMGGNRGSGPAGPTHTVFFSLGQLAERQASVSGKLDALAETFGLLLGGVALAQLLTPLQFSHLMLVLSRIGQPGFPPNAMQLAAVASQILSTGPGPMVVVTDPDDDFPF